MHREVKDRRIIVENALRAVAVMNVPVENRHFVDFLITLLRIPRRNSNVVEKTKTHGPIRCGMVSRRTHRHKRVPGGSLHDRIDSLTGSAGTPQCCFQRLSGNKSVAVEITFAVTYGLFDLLKEMRCVTGLNIAAPRFLRLDLEQCGPKTCITTQGIHHDLIAFGTLRMIRTGVM